MYVAFDHPDSDENVRQLTFRVPHPRLIQEEILPAKELLLRLLAHVFPDPVLVREDEDDFIVTYSFDNEACLKQLHLALHLFETGQEWTRFARS